MALKRRNRIEASFSMASMTDVIFLLLIFFMVTSTFVFPNAIKVLLPQSKEPDMYVALYADESVPYREVVKVLNIAGENKLRMVLATRPIKE